MKRRILQLDGRFYPQWKFPLLPLWCFYTWGEGNRVQFYDIEQAREYLNPAPAVRKIHNP